MAPGDDNDSGMESQEGSVRDGQDTDTAVSGGAKSIATSSAAGEDKSGRDDDDVLHLINESTLLNFQFFRLMKLCPKDFGG